MAEDSIKSTLRPAWRLAIAIAAGLALAVMVLAWPAIVRGDPPPVITQVEVTSSKSPYFYSPPLADTGGSVYFNSLSGAGAGQLITVTVTVSDDDPIGFDGGPAFGSTPSTSVPTTQEGTTSTWSVTYTIGTGDASEPGVVFTVTDSLSATDTISINFIQDNVSPSLSSPTIIENSQYLYAVGNTGIYYGNAMATAVPFTITGSASDSGGVGLGRATFSTALGDTPPDDTTPITWTAIYTAGSTNEDQGTITVTVYDKVGNSVAQTYAYTRDTEPPGLVFNYMQVPDADSGNDGFDPDTGWEDDLTVEFAWSASTDPGGSGIAGYLLSSTPPVTSAFYTATSGSLTMIQDGLYDVNIRAQDNVGNLSDLNYVNYIHLDREAPVNGRLDLFEESGGQYLFIADYTDITTGTLFYNNAATSSFQVTADNTDPSFEWGGDYSQPWKAAFSPGWGQSLYEDPSSPYRNTYTIDSLEITDVFTVYFINKAGNVFSIPINAELDTSGPAITFTSVTTPDWDADGDTSDFTNYWYRTGGLTSGWEFATGVTSEQAGVDPSVGWAYWDHSTGTTYDQSQAAPGGDGTFAGVSDDPDGMVTVTVVLTDRVNNSGDVSMTLNLDKTPPVITPFGWDESSQYLYIIGDELFFSHQMPGAQEANLSGDAADNPGGSGLDRAAFSSEPNLASSPGPDGDPTHWSGDYTFASSSIQGDGLAVVTIYDHVGNNITGSFTYTLDETAPVVTVTNVTDPGYDPVPPEEDTEGNWYASSDFNGGSVGGGWDFNFTFDDSQTGSRSASADWDHSTDTTDRTDYNPGLDGQGTFSNVSNDADGVVTVTVRVEDNVGNVGSNSLNLRIDKAPPTITSGGWSESSQFLHADGTTLYFGHQMAGPQQATLSGQANDGAGSGLDVMAFSSEPNLAGSPIPDDTPANWSGNYTFDNSSDQGDGTVVVSLQDNLYQHLDLFGRPDSSDHVKTKAYTYVLDITPPTMPTNFTITTPPIVAGYYNTRSLNLSWSSSTDDIAGSGLEGYYLGTNNPPTGFYPPTTTATPFNTGSDGIMTLYLAAKDNVGNTSLTSTAPITVDTQGPISSMTISTEEAKRRFLVQWSADDVTTWPVNYDVQYQVNNGVWKPWLSATTATSQYFGPSAPETVEPTILFRFRVRARDYVNNVGGWHFSPIVSVTRRYVYVPAVLGNINLSIPFFISGDFESGNFAGWKVGGVLPHSIEEHPVFPPGGTPPNGGTYAALLGSPSYGCGSTPNVPVGQAYIKVYINVPTGGTPFLRFQYRVLSYDAGQTKSGDPWERLEVQVNNTTLERYGNPNYEGLSCSKLYDSQWKSAEFDLSAYAGKTVILTFSNVTHKETDPKYPAPEGMSYYNTYSYVDNIRIEVEP
jgi:hypothetical protein